MVVGTGPNGLAAAIVLARRGLRVEAIEGADVPGGGCRTAELTLPGFRHDVCSTVQALATSSPLFRALDLPGHGLRLCTPEVAFAHPLDGGRAGAAFTSLRDTATSLGTDGAAYQRLLGPLVAHADEILPEVLAPLRTPPRHPVAMARFGAAGALPVSVVARRFRTAEARGLLAGVAAHAKRPLTAPLTTAFALVLMLVAHTDGWPVVEGGSAGLVDALLAVLEEAGGTVRTGEWVEDLGQLPTAALTMLDTSPAALSKLGGDRLPSRYRRALDRYRYGPAVCKVDWALSGPVPWTAEVCRRAGTVHVGGTFEEVARAEADVAHGRHAEQPFCIVVQPCVVDPTRAPAGSHTLWAYCHVPNGSDVDMTEAIESQLERFAPGFRDLVLSRTTLTALDEAASNPNHVGGDIAGGLSTIRQVAFRPTVRWDNYRTPVPGLYLCSSFTPPGGGVHGMCGAGAAQAALRYLDRT